MARPRLVKLTGGELSLNGFSKEEADALETYLSKFGKEEHTPVVVDNVQMIDPSDMPNKAVGLFLNQQTKQYQVAVVNYNPLTKQAKVESVKDAGEWRDAGINHFKMTCVEYKLI